MASTKFSKEELQNELNKTITFMKEEYMGFVPIENPCYAALITRIETLANLPVRGFYYIPREFWDLSLVKITPRLKELLVAGLPITSLEAASLPYKLIHITYDKDTDTGKSFVVLTPEEYLEECLKRVDYGENLKNDQIYRRLNILTQLIDKKIASASPDIVEEAELISKTSSHLFQTELDRLRRELRKYGTIKNPELKRQLNELYSS